MKIQIGSHTILIDKSDFELLQDFSNESLTVSQIRSSFYVTIRKTVKRKVNGVMKQVRKPFMASHVIMGLTKATKKCVVYRDSNGLNLQKRNLVVTERSNALKHRTSAEGSTSQYLGVTLTRSGKWQATIKPGPKIGNKYLGLFVEENDAAKAYNDAARTYHGTFANLNKIIK